MADNLKPEDRKKTMRAVKGKATKLEQRLFAMLAGMRLKGWQKNVGNIEGKPDVVFLHEKLVIFIDGCFWHGCTVCNKKLPETNREYWAKKIAHNVELAKTHDQKLGVAGWTIIRIWEHDFKDKTVMQSIKTEIRLALNKEQ